MLLGIEHPGLTCNRESVYTSSYTLNGCDGWSEISYEECKEKCVNNEIPASCKTPEVQSESCAYMDYHEISRWCHLAGNGCIMSKKEGAIVWEKYEPGKLNYFVIIRVVRPTRLK